MTIGGVIAISGFILNVPMKLGFFSENFSWNIFISVGVIMMLFSISILQVYLAIKEEGFMGSQRRKMTFIHNNVIFL